MNSDDRSRRTNGIDGSSADEGAWVDDDPICLPPNKKPVPEKLERVFLAFVKPG